MSLLANPTIRKWIAHSGEFASFLVFSGFSVLRGDLIKTDWGHAFEKNYNPKYLLGWALAGLSLALCRVLAGRFAKAEARGVLSAPDFIEKYRKMLSAAIESLSASSSADREALEAFEKSLLDAIADTVSYYRKATSLVSAKATANLMKPVAPTDEHKEGLWLEEGGFQFLHRVLVITKSSREELDIPAELALPVYKLDSPMKGRNIFGAPEAFVTGENKVIDFTLWPFGYWGRCSWSVRKKAYAYFWRHRKTLRSFASLPLKSKGNVVAVVNVHYKWIRILGKPPEPLIDFLVPFLLILGYIYVAKESAR